MNPYHDELGRFTSANGSKAPNKLFAGGTRNALGKSVFGGQMSSSPRIEGLPRSTRTWYGKTKAGWLSFNRTGKGKFKVYFSGDRGKTGVYKTLSKNAFREVLREM